MEKQKRKSGPASGFYKYLRIVEDANASEDERSDAFGPLTRLPFTDDYKEEWQSLSHFAAHHARKELRERIPEEVLIQIDIQSVVNMALVIFWKAASSNKFSRRKKFSPSNKFSRRKKFNRWAWLAGVAKRLALNAAYELYMIRGSRAIARPIDMNLFFCDAEIDEEEILSSTDWPPLPREALAVAIENLSFVLRETIELWVDFKNAEEIAEIRAERLGDKVSKGSVRTALSRARAKLKKSAPILLRELERLREAPKPVPRIVPRTSAPGASESASI